MHDPPLARYRDIGLDPPQRAPKRPGTLTEIVAGRAPGPGKFTGAAGRRRGHNATVTGMTADATGRPVTVRPLARADLARLSGWLAEPHVARWWRDPNDLAAVTATYQPCIDGTDPTEVFVIEAGGRPAGFIQRYLTADDPDWDRAVQATGAVTGCSAGIDYLIDRDQLTGPGAPLHPRRPGLRQAPPGTPGTRTPGAPGHPQAPRAHQASRAPRAGTGVAWRLPAFDTRFGSIASQRGADGYRPEV